MMEFALTKLRSWDRWLESVNARLKESYFKGSTKKKYYEVDDSKGVWVVHLLQYGDTEVVYVWAPDGLQVIPPEEPSWEALKASLGICTRCRRAGAALSRAGFAGRWCDECRRKHLHEVEYPGWTE